MRRPIYLNNIEITLREVLASISIVSIMMILGIVIWGKIDECIQDGMKKYETAISIQDSELFQYALRTDAGYSFCYGEISALNPINSDFLNGKYIGVQKRTERYTMHTRTVTSGTGKNKTTRTEIYYTWDEIDRESKISESIQFLGVDFESKDFCLPDFKYEATERIRSDIRIKYYIIPDHTQGTLFCNIQNENLEQSEFYEEQKIEQVREYKTNDNLSVIIFWVFWIFWVFLMIVLVFGFYALENKWLE